MKKFLALILVFSITVISFTVNASTPFTTSENAVISVDPIDLLFEGRINATYEKKLNVKNSFTMNATYWHYSSHGSAFGVGGSYRWYFDLFEEDKSALNGFSVGPRADVFFWNWNYDDPNSKNTTYTTLALGGEVNYKWVFDSKWSVEPTIKFVFPVVKQSGYKYTNYGLGVNLGYCF